MQGQAIIQTSAGAKNPLTHASRGHSFRATRVGRTRAKPMGRTLPAFDEDTSCGRSPSMRSSPSYLLAVLTIDHYYVVVLQYT